MIEVTVIEAGQNRRARGRTVAGIARREFNCRTAEVRLEPTSVLDAEYATWTATYTDRHGTHVLGRIIEPLGAGQ